MLVVYVDDFNLSTPVGAQDRLWKALQGKINLEKPSSPDRFLGCYRREFTAKASALECILQNKPELYPRQAKKSDPLVTKTMVCGRCRVAF